MNGDYDILIIGSGPSGVSAAFPLVEAGLRVLMLDQGRLGDDAEEQSAETYRSIREHDTEQWRRFVGEDFSSLKVRGNVSPKLKVPSHQYVFDGFQDAYDIETKNFEAIGSLAQGGLSNAWGAGAYVYDAEDLKDYPISHDDLLPSYQAVSERIGISGSSEDDLGSFYGGDVSLQAPVELDANMARLFARYQSSTKPNSLKIGRARNAVLTQNLENRQACHYTNRCLWSCPVGSIYSAAYDLASLQKFENFTYRDKAFVQGFSEEGGGYQVSFGDGSSIKAKKLILAAGTIGSTKLALDFLGHKDKAIPLSSNPAFAIAFLNWCQLGSEIQDQGFALGQLGFAVEHAASYSHGVLFSASSIAVSELTKYMPFSYRGATTVARLMMPAMFFANCFLDSSFSQHHLSLSSNGGLEITGAYAEHTDGTVAELGQKLAKSFRQLGAYALEKPVMSKPGADIHYCGTLPMTDKPTTAPAANSEGLIFNTKGLYVVDGAALPRIPAKNPTLSIMANADRIARGITREMKNT